MTVEEYLRLDYEKDIDKIVQYNRELTARYPWLIPGHGDSLYAYDSDYDFHYTMLDDLPDGWRIAFGEDICKEIDDVLRKYDYVDSYSIVQIKEKYGALRWYNCGLPAGLFEEINAIIDKYEKISERTCIVCGKPAKFITTGWICPWCEDCINKTNDKVVPIEEYFK